MALIIYYILLIFLMLFYIFFSKLNYNKNFPKEIDKFTKYVKDFNNFKDIEKQKEVLLKQEMIENIKGHWFLNSLVFFLLFYLYKPFSSSLFLTIIFFLGTMLFSLIIMIYVKKDIGKKYYFFKKIIDIIFIILIFQLFKYINISFISLLLLIFIIDYLLSKIIKWE